jgi:hypothetical protein
MTCSCPGYAVLVVLSVVIVMGAGVCYRTRAYRNRPRTAGEVGFVARPSVIAARDWGPKPKLFDAYLHPPRETPESDWDAMTVRAGCILFAFPLLILRMKPISVTRGALDASGVSTMARVAIMIRMPSLEPFVPPETLDDDERQLPHLEIGQSDLSVLLTSPEADEAASKKKGS